jgi:NADPH-dependent curcumin reductase CurA
MADTVNRQWILKQRPKGRLAETDFELRQGPVPEPGPGEVLTRTLYISVDAANRAWMSPVRTYIEPVEPGSHGDNVGKRMVRVAPEPRDDGGDS